MNLREGYVLGLKIDIATFMIVISYVFIFNKEISWNFLKSYFLGFISMAVVIYLVVRPGEEGGYIGSYVVNRNFLIFICGASIFVLIYEIYSGVPYSEYVWIVVVLGGWTGNKVAWLLRNRNIHGK